MARPTHNTTQLTKRAMAGDGGAREELLRWLESVLRSFFVGRLGVRDEIDDLVQNSLLRVHNGLGDLRNPTRLKAFAMKAALFELHDFYRGRYRSKEDLAGEDALLASGHEGARSSDTIDLDRALEALSPKARRILELRQYGYRYVEIAEMIGSTEAAVKMQVKRAFDKLREILACVAAVPIMLLLHSC